MKKSILLMLICGGCLIATAQTPDTLSKFNSTATSPDSTLPSPTQVAPVEAAPPSNTVTDTTQMAPDRPMNTDVKNNAMADTSAAQISSTQSSVPDTNTSNIPVVPMPTGDTMLTNAPAMPANEPMATQPNTQPNTQQNIQHNTQNTQQSTQTDVKENTSSIYTMPRGVNNTDMALTGLRKWSALPILNTYVPQDIVDKLKMEQGDKLYDITMMKTGENQYGYIARVQENGVYHNIMVNGTSNSSMQ